MKNVFDLQAKHELAVGGGTLGGEHSGKMFFMIGHQVYSHLSRDFGSLPCNGRRPIHRHPVPLEKEPRGKMSPTLCLTVGMEVMPESSLVN